MLDHIRPFFTAVIGALFFVSGHPRLHAAPQEPTEHLKQRFIEEYRHCTGDTTPVAFDVILRWKRELNTWTESDNYRRLVTEYIGERGDTAALLPCRIREWNLQRQRRISEPEVIIGAEDSSTHVADTAVFAASPFDFDSIPFGISRTALMGILSNKKFTPEQLPDKTVVREMTWAGVPVSTAFHFDATGGFYKWELETAHYPADSLNAVVRPAAARMVEALSAQLGRPNRTGRIGLYDIVQGRLAPYAHWEDSAHGAYVGLATHSYRYYAKVIVLRKQTSP